MLLLAVAKLATKLALLALLTRSKSWGKKRNKRSLCALRSESLALAASCFSFSVAAAFFSLSCCCLLLLSHSLLLLLLLCGGGATRRQPALALLGQQCSRHSRKQERATEGAVSRCSIAALVAGADNKRKQPLLQSACWMGHQKSAQRGSWMMQSSPSASQSAGACFLQDSDSLFINGQGAAD